MAKDTTKKTATENTTAPAPTVLNAIITKTVLGYEVADKFVVSLKLSGEGWEAPYAATFNKEGAELFIIKSLEKMLAVLGVKTWEELTNLPIRLVILDNKIVQIGHIVKSEWFSFEETINSLLPKEETPKKDAEGEIKS